MSGRKNKHKQRGRQHGQPSELLDELNSLRDLLGSEDIGEIPLLDQVAAPGNPRPAAPPKAQPQPQEPLDESDLPILFSPVDEAMPADVRAELDESDLELLRPLQALPSAPRESKPEPRPEQQRELFEPPPAAQGKENPFLPAHIRARLTGGRVPKSEDRPAQSEAPAAPQEAREVETAPAPPETAPAAEAAETAGNPAMPADAEREERARLRQQLIDRLVAKQLPELERQLRARIEAMVDELEISG